MEEGEMRTQLSLYLRAFVLVLGLALAAVAQDLGPLVELSQPNAVGSCNTGFNAFGIWPMDEAAEPFVAVNPIQSNNFVAAWIQDDFQDIIAATSFDGGQTWQQVPIPLTVCSGGSFLGVADPWLSFAPDGTLYAVALTTNSLTFPSKFVDEVMITKSIDGGLHWSAPSVVPGSDRVDPFADHPSLTADPTDARFVYAIWNGSPSSHSAAAVFTRTTDGGLTWETARAIVQTASQSYIQFSQILVLPNGTLVEIFEFYAEQPNKPITFTNLQVMRSTDRGQTWSSPINAVTMTPLYRPNGNTLVVDPETGEFVSDVTNPSFALDDQNGNLYAVWEDGRFSNFQYNDIAFSMSTDGGSTWSAPIRVNQTPLNLPVADRQAFFPSIAVTTNGTIGVSYYDFRFNDPSPGLPTDRWLVQCEPSPKNPATNPACWGNEVGVTNHSFNMEAVLPIIPNGFFLGDYFGLAAGNDFLATFTAVDSENITSIFARPIGQ
jgi:BNR repeat protein